MVQISHLFIMTNLYLKRFFLGCLFIFSFNTVLFTQSLTNEIESVNDIMSYEDNLVKKTPIRKADHSMDSIPKTQFTLRKESKENSNTQYFKLKSKSGVLSFFNELIFYWFHQL